jgi:hypothetical protein
VYVLFVCLFGALFGGRPAYADAVKEELKEGKK